ncbi:MAG: hypothetical protein VCA36_01330 [Opitutales bacterium]
MKRGFSILTALCLLAGCQQVDDIQDQMFGKEISQEDPPPEDPETNAPETESNPEISPSPLDEQIGNEPEKPAPKPIPPVPAGPIQPKETPELLRIVNNWRAIPYSAFPRQVSVNRPVNFIVRDASGNKVGGASFPPGSKVVAFEQVGPMISVGPSPSSPMRTMVGINDTDLKQVLIYAYELTKRRQTEVSMVRPRQRPPTIIRRPTSPRRPPSASVSPPPAKPTPKPTTKPTRNPKKDKVSPLFEDVPEPRDLGHGKWCVCRDCRIRRGIGR